MKKGKGSPSVTGSDQPGERRKASLPSGKPRLEHGRFRRTPRGKVVPLAIAAASVLGLLGAWFLWLRPRAELGPGAWKGRNVLLVTVDTLRADRIGAYGFKEIATPNIDALAAEGVLFENCVAPTPLTLPSHTSLLSGTYPLRHGVRDNGGFVVPRKLTTLAELYKARGYRTGAFVGAFVLDSRWGLDRGFDEYFDDFDLRKENVVSIGDIERRGDEVVDAALTWLSQKRSAPFFLWIHLYDPHSPYEPPPPFQEQYADRPYLGEIAFTDAQIGRVLRALEEGGQRDRTAIVFAADHGESLGEHQEQGHGFFVYQPTVRVPLIFSPPAGRSGGLRRRETVSLVDVFPTLVEMGGLKLTPGVQGRSLAPLFAERTLVPETPVYAETYYPRMHYGWSDLKAIQDDRYKLILSSEPELYDLRRDPGEQTSLAETEPSLLLEKRRRAAALLAAWARDAIPTEYRSEDPETVAKLASLGYIGSGSAPVEETAAPLPSPRRRIEIYNLLAQARELTAAKDYEGAERALERILAADAGVIDAYTALGNLRLRQARYTAAAAAFREALRRKPIDPWLVLGLATAELESGRLDAAEQTLVASLDSIPSDSRIYMLLGAIAEKRKDSTRAASYLQKVLELDPGSASAWAALAEISFGKGNLDEAERRLTSALARDPKVPGAHYYRARILESKGRLEEAIEEYLVEARIAPSDRRSLLALSSLYRRLGRLADEEAFLRRVVSERPGSPIGYFYLAKNLMDRGERLPEALRLAREGVEQGPSGSDLALGHLLLADLYSRLGEPGLSLHHAQKGRASAARQGG